MEISIYTNYMWLPTISNLRPTCLHLQPVDEYIEYDWHKPIDENKLQSDSGGFHSNHSLRANTASRL